MRERLEQMRAALAAEAAEGAEAAEPVKLDQTRVGRLSRMDALQSQAMAQASQARRADMLRQIDAALARLDEGSYGECKTCGEPISAARLEADPIAALCIACAAEAEEESR